MLSMDSQEVTSGDVEMAEGNPPEVFVSALLQNPIRAQILELLDETPGMNKHQLATALDAHMTVVDFHVQRLVESRLLETRSGHNGRETLCFTTHNAGLWENPSTRVLFGRGAVRQVAMFVTDHPGADAQSTAEALSLSIYTVRRHLRTLEEFALVQRIRVERQVIYHAAPQLVSWVEGVGRKGRWGPDPSGWPTDQPSAPRDGAAVRPSPDRCAP